MAFAGGERISIEVRQGNLNVTDDSNILPFPKQPVALTEEEEAPKELPEAAKRALAEAEERRKKAQASALPKELGGREGPEPVRYGDWEKDGLAIDF